MFDGGPVMAYRTTFKALIAGAGAWLAIALAPGLAVSQQGHLANLSSFITSQVGHFHLPVASWALNPDEAQLEVLRGSFSLSLPEERLNNGGVAVVVVIVAFGANREGMAGAPLDAPEEPGLVASQQGHLLRLSSFMTASIPKL